MKFINFSNDSPNYRLSDGAMIWNVAPWTLGDDISEIALSSCFLFLDRKISWKPIILNCSLIDANYANYNGTIATVLSQSKAVIHNPPILEFWKLDCSRPRTVVFNIKGIEPQNIKQISITLALQ